MSAANPFNYNLPVAPEMFFGRQTDVETLTRRLTASPGDSFALIGGRRMGKTSLLEALKRSLESLGRASDGSLLALPVYLDLLGEGNDSANSFFNAVMDEVQEELAYKLDQAPTETPHIKEGQPCGPAFRRQLKRWRQDTMQQLGRRLRIILLLDECEEIVEEAWTSDLHAHLRYLVGGNETRGAFKVVMAGSHGFLTQVDQKGSPLWNMLAYHKLQVLDRAAERDLIVQPTEGALSKDTTRAIAAQCGGHAFLDQYILHHLWEEGLASATPEAVRALASRFSQARPDFRDWAATLGEFNLGLYAELEGAPEALAVERLQTIAHPVPGDTVQQGLEALCYHGLVTRQPEDASYAIAGQMFRAWFTANVDLDRPGPSEVPEEKEMPVDLDRVPDERPPYGTVRSLLGDAFAEEELRNFCLTRPLFQELKKRFSDRDGLDVMVRKVLTYVDTEWLWKEFLLAVAEEKPRQFNRYASELGWPQVPVPVGPTTPPQPEREPQEPSPTLPDQTTYADVQIHVHPRQGESYPVYIQTPMKADAQGTFVRPWTQDELLVKLTRLEKDEVDRDSMMEMGTQLFQALFSGFVQDRFKEARNRVEATGQTGQGLRLRLWIEPPELQLWPWELLCDDERDAFLGLSGRTLITRYLSVPRVVHPLAVQPPLRVLIAAAAPDDQPFLDVEAEIAAVQEALRPLEAPRPLEDRALMQVQVLPHAGRMSLREALRKQKPHILHYVGHGVIGRRGGALVLEKENGRSDALPGSTLGAILERNGVRLAVLNACVTAKGATTEKGVAGDQRRAVLGVGPALLEAGLGAVVAMQFSLKDKSALVFASDLYQKLAELDPVDQAVSLAREALWLQVGEDARDWATPVLFMRVPDGRLFIPPG